LVCIIESGVFREVGGEAAFDLCLLMLGYHILFDNRHSRLCDRFTDDRLRFLVKHERSSWCQLNSLFKFSGFALVLIGGASIADINSRRYRFGTF
jgi:hypothetical protein